MTPPRPNRQRRVTIAELCDRHDNEDVHTTHVTTLALRLFDDTAGRLGLTPADRVILETAARLHDVGYRGHPRDHVAASVRLVQRTRLAGLSPAQRAYVAAVVALHSKRRRAPWRHPAVDALPDPGRARRLGAFLRLADGLDFSHLQDCQIIQVEHRPRSVVVQAQVDHFPANLVQADRKADLWRTTLPFGVRLVRFIPPTGPGPLVSRRTALPEAARRLMWRQYKIILLNLEGAGRGEDPEHLHDIRVAMRRLRALLGTFAKHLPVAAAEIDRGLQALGRALGAARDLDVWVQFLESGPVREHVGAPRGWRQFVDHYRVARTLQYATVRRCLRGRACRAVRQRLTRLLRIELPRAARAGSPPPVVPLAARKLRKSARRALRHGHLRKSPEPADRHELRVLLRRARYLGEFFGDALGGRTTKLTKLLHRAERALAHVHDADVALARLQREGPRPPRALIRLLEQRRAHALTAIPRAWDRLASDRFQDKINARLKRLAR